MAQQIFVLGLQRSGTTWIGNLLAAHPEVAGVTAPRHQGIHESLFFSHFARAWDWSLPEGRTRAIDAFLASDYGRMMGLDAEAEARVRAATAPAEAFGAAMDWFAARRRAVAWVEKSPHHTRHAEAIAGALRRARFVAIHRETVSLLSSRLTAYDRPAPRGPKRVLAILRASASNAYHARLIDRLERAHPKRVIRLDYELFRAGGDASVAALIADLGLEPAPGLAPGFAPNSSRSGKLGAPRPLGRRDMMLVRAAEGAVGLLPLGALAALRRMVARRRITFPAWVWADRGAAPADVTIAKPRLPAS